MLSELSMMQIIMLFTSEIVLSMYCANLLKFHLVKIFFKVVYNFTVQKGSMLHCFSTKNIEPNKFSTVLTLYFLRMQHLDTTDLIPDIVTLRTS